MERPGDDVSRMIIALTNATYSWRHLQILQMWHRDDKTDYYDFVVRLQSRHKQLWNVHMVRAEVGLFCTDLN